MRSILIYSISLNSLNKPKSLELEFIITIITNTI